MLNPDVSKIISDYERIENTLAELTPNPANFAGSIYSTEDVQSDMKQLDTFKHTPEYKVGNERSDAKLLEKTFTDIVERGDWFSEEELYGDDPAWLALTTFPAAEIDDVFNHIDTIGMINNEITNHETLPFAIDLTYNMDMDKMDRKFKWKHAYGKKKVPEGVSEFGESHLEQDYTGRDILRTYALPLKFRNGLKIPGFASAKYFEDKNNPWDPMHDKGRIELMPRFIVGYSTDLANTLANGLPTNADREKYGDQYYEKKRSEYKAAEKRAKWCTLFECSDQASDICHMLEKMNAEETRWMDPEELEKAKKQIIAMNTYFSKAIEVATKKAQIIPEEMVAMQYADKDKVRREIRLHSSNTYIDKNW